MASAGLAFAAGGLLTGIGAAAVNAAENSGKEERESRRLETEHKNRLEEMKQGADSTATNQLASDQRHAQTQTDITTLTGKQQRDLARQKEEADKPLKDAQTDQALAGAEYSRARATSESSTQRVGMKTGKVYEEDDKPDEPTSFLNRKQHVDLVKQISRNETSAANTRTNADTRTAIAKDRKFAPDEITKIRAARDALPDDHPDRPIYDAHLREIAAGKGTLTAAKQSEIRLRVSKDVQTATDARGKNLYPTPEAQDAEVERRINKIMPTTAAAQPAPAPKPKPAPATPQYDPAPADPRARKVDQIYTSPSGKLGKWTGSGWEVVQ